MESFSRVDIFDTKGIEYIFVIAYLLILIVFWKLSNKQFSLKAHAKNAINLLSAYILKIPQGLFFNKHHTWAYLEETGTAKVGVDDFVQHLTGTVELNKLIKPGQVIKKGELLTELEKDSKLLKVFSPISGEVLSANASLFDHPEFVNEDPYDSGWLYKIKPENWVAETKGYYVADKATEWFSKELERFKDFLMLGSMNKYQEEPSMVMLQDGGELCDNILSNLPDEVWNDFQKAFLDMEE